METSLDATGPRQAHATSPQARPGLGHECVPQPGDRHLPVAVLFSGGDAPGMNAILRAVVRLGLNRYQSQVLGVKDGYAGLERTCRRIFRGECTVEQLQEELAAATGHNGLRRRDQTLVWMDHNSVSGVLGRGGIILGSSRCPEFCDSEIRRQAIDLLADLGVTALIVCGGNGSLTGAACLARESDLQVIGIPATIDNDVPATDLALGVDTAINTLTDAIGRFNDTADSHHRIMVLETMGRDCGELARLAALASGAEIVVTPEQGVVTESKLIGIARRIEESILLGRSHAIVLVSEGITFENPTHGGPAQAIARYLERHFQKGDGGSPSLETRASVLGHLQRGGRPTAGDRILAAKFAEAAWDAIARQQSGVLGLRGSRIRRLPFDRPPSRSHDRSRQRMYQLQKDLSKHAPLRAPATVPTARGHA